MAIMSTSNRPRAGVDLTAAGPTIMSMLKMVLVLAGRRKRTGQRRSARLVWRVRLLLVSRLRIERNSGVGEPAVACENDKRKNVNDKRKRSHDKRCTTTYNKQ